MLIWLWVLIALISAIVIIAIFYYNRFTVLENRIDNSLSQIDVQLKKRNDLVPNLVKTVQGYVKHEKQIMNDVTKSRKEMLSSKNINDRVKAGDHLQTALRSIFAIAENYPQLRANENFLQLQQELSAIEDKIAYSRQFYNDSVLDYENSSEKFPGVFFFKLYGRTKREFLKIPETEKEIPKIEF